MAPRTTKAGSIRGTSLEEVLIRGEGIERPFRCHMHDDSGQHASVNVLKGVWYCFSCGAKGMTDGKGKPPTLGDLQYLLNAEEPGRVYPEAYLELFENDLGNWPTRFSPWIRWNAQLGCDPLTGDATFPVRTPQYKLAGVGRRKAVVDDGPRYLYPPRWSAAQSVFEVGVGSELMFLTEGAGDATGVAEVGAYALGMYGAGVHFPQIELIKRRSPRLVMLAFDADEAGLRAISRATDALSGLVKLGICDWSQGGGKDPNELSLADRREVMLDSVGRTGYVHHQQLGARWTTHQVQIQAAFAAYQEERR